MLKNSMLYGALNYPVLSVIPESATQILDVGCGSGVLGKFVKQKQNCQVSGITYSTIEAEIASQILDSVFIYDLNDFNFNELRLFDCIVCSHVLEHVYAPESLLVNLKNHLNPGGVLIVALPNVLHWKQRLEFLKGNFKYTEGGLMDKTHVRFFDWDTASELVENSGYRITVKFADGYFPLPGLRKVAPSLAQRLDKLASQAMPGLFGVQFMIVAQPSQ